MSTPKGLGMHTDSGLWCIYAPGMPGAGNTEDLTQNKGHAA